MKKFKIKQKQNRSGFTLVELVIVIAIVIILSVISVPIYRGYVDKSKMAEGYALLGTILSAQKAYYSEYGNFYFSGQIGTCYEPMLGIDARANKYFTCFMIDSTVGSNYRFSAKVRKPEDLKYLGKGNECIGIHYTLTKVEYTEYNW